MRYDGAHTRADTNTENVQCHTYRAHGRSIQTRNTLVSATAHDDVDFGSVPIHAGQGITRALWQDTLGQNNTRLDSRTAMQEVTRTQVHMPSGEKPPDTSALGDRHSARTTLTIAAFHLRWRRSRPRARAARTRAETNTRSTSICALSHVSGTKGLCTDKEHIGDRHSTRRR